MTEPSVFAPVETSRPGRLIRVSRPGRGTCGSSGFVPEEVMRSWLDGVWKRLDLQSARQALPVDYVCLLGTKNDGRREIWDFYPARGPDDPQGKPTFEDVLNRLEPAGRMLLRVHHVPTVDHERVPATTIARVKSLLEGLLQERRIVLLGCSAAQGRTREVLEAIEWAR